MNSIQVIILVCSLLFFLSLILTLALKAKIIGIIFILVFILTYYIVDLVYLLVKNQLIESTDVPNPKQYS